MARDPAVLVADDAMRGGEVGDLRALVLGGLDLLGDRRHVLPLAPVDDRHVRPEPARRAGGVDGGVPAADDDDASCRPGSARRATTASRNGSAGMTPVELGAGKVDPRLLPGADGEEDRVVLVRDLVERDVLADVDVELEPHAEALDELDLLVEDRLRQAVLRQRVAEHAAGRGPRVVDGHAVAEEGEVEGAGEAGRARRRRSRSRGRSARGGARGPGRPSRRTGRRAAPRRR